MSEPAVVKIGSNDLFGDFVILIIFNKERIS